MYHGYELIIFLTWSKLILPRLGIDEDLFRFEHSTFKITEAGLGALTEKI
jgi:hypothetical protein